VETPVVADQGEGAASMKLEAFCLFSYKRVVGKS